MAKCICSLPHFTGYIKRGKMWSIILANLDPNEIVPCNSWG